MGGIAEDQLESGPGRDTCQGHESPQKNPKRLLVKKIPPALPALKKLLSELPRGHVVMRRWFPLWVIAAGGVIVILGGLSVSSSLAEDDYMRVGSSVIFLLTSTLALLWLAKRSEWN